MKDRCGEYIFPEHWFLEIDEENKEIVNNWRINIIEYDTQRCPYPYITENGSGCGKDVGGFKGIRSKISTFQFKKYILNIIEDLPVVKEEENLGYLVELFERLKIK